MRNEKFKMNPLNKLKDLFEKLTKKQLLGIFATIPVSFFLGMVLQKSLAKIGDDFEKYNTGYFLVSDSAKVDTFLIRTGELYIDTLVDYHRLSEKEISFKSVNDINSKGFLSVRNKEFFKYKILRNGIASKEIFEKNKKTKTYFLADSFIKEGFELERLETMEYKMSSSLEDSFNINNSEKKAVNSEIYTKETGLGKIVLDNEMLEVNNYLNKILEYKAKLKPETF